MYFISKLYQSAKTAIAVSGVTGSLLAIVYGALQSGGAVFIVGGSLCLANSLFNLVEIGKVNIDIKKQIKSLEASIGQFVEHNLKLEENVRAEQTNNKNHAQENNRLRTLVSKSEKHISRLETLQGELTIAKGNVQREADCLTIENKNFSNTSKELRSQLATVKRLKDQYSTENSDFAKTIQELRDQVGVIDQLKDQTIAENQVLHVNNEKLELQISRQTQIIIESKSLIQNLAQFGDRYTAFAETLDGDLVRLDNTSTDLDETSRVLQKLVEQLKNETFDKLDINNDGVITRQEFHDRLGIL
uniref:EF-hand domain-containing protein n=1 Tax=Marseillevirus LCMAC202 TaxID=2506606 RepID=A0A481YZQ6_9VIRU|nr:MAG: uncharacterized protein LCMAC202_03070 [Marseillevirus LCMAC202]